MSNEKQDGGTKLLTIEEACARLRMPRSTFASYLNREGFLTRIKVGRRVLFDAAEVENYINRSRQSAA